MEDMIELNSLSQLENTSTQFIPISININDLVDEYADVDKRENHQNRRDNDYIEKELTNQNQNQQSQQVERNRQNIRVDDYVEEELTDQNQQSQQVERERQATDRPRRIKIPSYKARQNMIPIDEFLKPLSTYEEALSRPDTEKWIAAMNIPNKALILNGT